MSLKGATKGFIIYSSKQAQHHQNRAFHLLPPPESGQAPLIALLCRDHSHRKGCRSCLPPLPVAPLQGWSSEATHLWSSHLYSQLDGKFTLQFDLRTSEMRFVSVYLVVWFFFLKKKQQTSKNSLLISLIFQRKLCLSPGLLWDIQIEDTKHKRTQPPNLHTMLWSKALFIYTEQPPRAYFKSLLALPAELILWTCLHGCATCEEERDMVSVSIWKI